jgi:hypothetical protein
MKGFGEKSSSIRESIEGKSLNPIESCNRVKLRFYLVNHNLIPFFLAYVIIKGVFTFSIPPVDATTSIFLSPKLHGAGANAAMNTG